MSHKDIVALDAKIIGAWENINEKNLNEVYKSVCKFAKLNRELKLMCQVDTSIIQAHDNSIKATLVKIQDGESAFVSEDYVRVGKPILSIFHQTNDGFVLIDAIT